MKLFSDESWWNQPIPSDAPAYPESAEWGAMLQEFCGHGIHLNLSQWTIPVVQVDDSVPRVTLRKSFEIVPDDHSFVRNAKGQSPMGHGPGIEQGVPIPPDATPDHMADAHLCVIHKETGQAWDMWAVRKFDDGTWGACAACTYDSRGSGILDDPAYRPRLGESVHLYGPSRAAGVPIPAGLIFREEIEAGVIEHRLAFACEYVAFQRHVFPPAIWTDGWYRGGVPEGAVLQLDPSLDLSGFGLSPGAMVVAKALQKYGAAVVDYGTGAAVYGEYLPAADWEASLVPSALHAIPFSHYRFLRLGEERDGGDDPTYHGDFGAKFRAQEGLSP